MQFCWSYAGSCDGYANLTHPWRNRGFTSTTFSGYPHDDAALVNNWWRFTGIGGDKIVTSCFGQNYGGTNYPISVAFSYPVTESTTATTGQAECYVTHCGQFTLTINVVLCPGGFYIYRPTSHPHSSMGYVTCKDYFSHFSSMFWTFF